MTDGPLLRVGAHGERRLHFSWKAAALLGLFAVRLFGVVAELRQGPREVEVADLCAAPECERAAATGSVLCNLCEQRWMRDRDQVVKAAEHLADMSAQFSAWCEARGLPNPFD